MPNKHTSKMPRSAKFEQWMDCADALLMQLATRSGQRRTEAQWRTRLECLVASGAVMALAARQAGVTDTSPAAIPFKFATRASVLQWVRVDRAQIWRRMAVRP
jgi:hypothetical protein